MVARVTDSDSTYTAIWWIKYLLKLKDSDKWERQKISFIYKSNKVDMDIETVYK